MSNHFWFVSLFSVLLGLLIATILFWLRERRLREGRLSKRRHQQRIDYQTNLGNRVYNAIKVACDQNRLVRFQIDREQNDSTFGYFIVVRFVDDPKHALGKKVLDISIKLNSPEDYEQVEVRWEGHRNHEWSYKMDARRFGDGPEIPILAGRLKAYVPTVSLM